MSEHKHRAVRVISETTYQVPVAYPPRRQNILAQGNITQTVECSCGATQMRNRNMFNVEYGEWSEREDK